jgi:hypothetical protein
VIFHDPDTKGGAMPRTMTFDRALKSGLEAGALPTPDPSFKPLKGILNVHRRLLKAARESDGLAQQKYLRAAHEVTGLIVRQLALLEICGLREPGDLIGPDGRSRLLNSEGQTPTPLEAVLLSLPAAYIEAAYGWQWTPTPNENGRKRVRYVRGEIVWREDSEPTLIDTDLVWRIRNEAGRDEETGAPLTTPPGPFELDKVAAFNIVKALHNLETYGCGDADVAIPSPAGSYERYGRPAAQSAESSPPQAKITPGFGDWLNDLAQVAGAIETGDRDLVGEVKRAAVVNAIDTPVAELAFGLSLDVDLVRHYRFRDARHPETGRSTGEAAPAGMLPYALANCDQAAAVVEHLTPREPTGVAKPSMSGVSPDGFQIDRRTGEKPGPAQTGTNDPEVTTNLLEQSGYALADWRRPAQGRTAQAKAELHERDVYLAQIRRDGLVTREGLLIVLGWDESKLTRRSQAGGYERATATNDDGHWPSHVKLQHEREQDDNDD